MIAENETIALGWCDNGLVDGRFASGIVELLVTSPRTGINITASIRTEGNQIARQRQQLFEHWANELKTDWLLWVDSDVVISSTLIKSLLSVADKTTIPIVSGIYFISKSSYGELLMPYANIFNNVDDNTIEYIHPLPENKLIKIDQCGMGLVLMHISVVEKLKEKFINEPVFVDKHSSEGFVSEDISFFRKIKDVGIPVYAHTGVIAKHVKRFPLDIDYYNAFWNHKNT
jgi:hypothetical protein